MTIARTAVSAASLNGILYAVGGECAPNVVRDDTMYLRSLESYDPVLKVDCEILYTLEQRGCLN